MKLIIYIFLALSPLFSFAQLSKEAMVLREANPEAFNNIRFAAIKKWNGDNPKVSNEINRQSEARLKIIIENNPLDENIYFFAYKKSVYNKVMFNDLTNQGRVIAALKLPVDWVLFARYYKELIERCKLYPDLC